MDIFPAVILLARPAAGKSEVMDYLKSQPLETRVERFHIGSIHEIDDFPMLWAWFEEDRILEEMGYPRLHTDSEGYFTDHYLWNLLIERISLDYRKFQRDSGESDTALIEFSRGTEHGGYAEAFAHLSDELLHDASVLYIDVSYEESVRKNSGRFNPDKPDSVLEHGLPADKMERLYRESDWEDVSGPDPHYLHIGNSHVPYVVFDNEDDVTTRGGDFLGNRLESCFDTLWKLFSSQVP